jgi:DNA repair protein SbcD/Mre11
MVRLVFLADSHLGFDYPVRPRIKRRRRGDDFFANFERVLLYAKKSKADLVIHGGDFFFRAKVPPKIVEKAYRILLDFADSGIPFVITPGNHERSRLPMVEKLQHSNIHIFTRPDTFLFDVGGVKIAISGFPFERRFIRDQFKGILKLTRWKIQSAQIRLLLMHQAVEGATVGASNFTFRGSDDVVCLQDIPPQFSAVLCGHIHRRQILIAPEPGSVPVIFPGSIERTSFAEREENKGFFELNFARNVGIGKSNLKKLFLRLPSRPMIDIEIDSHTDQNRVKSMILSRISEISADAVVRFNLSDGGETPLKKFINSRFLREILPESMNFQFGRNFIDYQDRR